MAIQRYVDNDGQPTCAADVANKCYCPFLSTSVFGTREHCFWEMRDNPGPHPPQLERRDRGRGFTIPYPGCPLWHRQPGWQGGASSD